MTAWMLSTTLLLLSFRSEGKGVVDFVYEPKHCITDPCPQFRMVAIDHELVENVGVDIRFAERSKPKLKALDKIQVEGRWKESTQFPGYFEFFPSDKQIKRLK